MKAFPVFYYFSLPAGQLHFAKQNFTAKQLHFAEQYFTARSAYGSTTQCCSVTFAPVFASLTTRSNSMRETS